MLSEVNVKYLKRITLIVCALLLVIPCVLSAQWESDYRLTTNSDSSFTSNNNAWCVAANADTIHVVWYDNRDGNYEIYYKCSYDGGATWGSDTRLTNEPSPSYNPSVAFAGTEVHVVWEDERNQDIDVYHKCSTDGGITWEPDILVTDVSGPQGMPSVAVVTGCVHVVWADFSLIGNTEIYYGRSTDGGTTWQAPVQMSYAPMYSVNPSIAAYGSNVHVVWHDSRLGWWNNEIFYRRSTDDGVNWSGEQQLTNDTTFSNTPSIAVSGNNVHVTWEDMRDGNFEIYYKNSTDNGETWSSDVRLTNDAGDSHLPSASASGSNLHITWQDNRDGNDEIYYKVSNDYGISWDPDIRLTDDQGVSQNASIAVSGEKVHVVWTDDRDGNSEIYYKRNPTGNPGIAEFDNGHPTVFYLVASPNPFSYFTDIRYQITENRQKDGLKIYDVIGSLVADLSKQTSVIGYQSSVRWDGTDQVNRQLPNGVYFVKLEVDGQTETQKLLLIR